MIADTAQGKFNIHFPNDRIQKRLCASLHPDEILRLAKPDVVKIDLEGLDDFVLEFIISSNSGRPLIITECLSDINRTKLKSNFYSIYEYPGLSVCYPNREHVHVEMDLPISLIRI